MDTTHKVRYVGIESEFYSKNLDALNLKIRRDFWEIKLGSANLKLA